MVSFEVCWPEETTKYVYLKNMFYVIFCQFGVIYIFLLILSIFMKLSLLENDWFCSTICENSQPSSSSNKKPKSSQEFDGVHEYTCALVWGGLVHQVRLDAERENDGLQLNSLWKTDVPFLWKDNHNKYLILGHRITAGKFFPSKRGLRNIFIMGMC